MRKRNRPSPAQILRMMAAAAQLTSGAVAAIAEHADGMGALEPVLQVVDVQAVVGSTSSARFRLVLSDGVYTLQSMLGTADDAPVRDGSIRKGSIIRLREFTCSTIQSRRVIVFLQHDILQSEHDIIGNSKPFEMKNVPQEQCPGTTSVNQGMLVEVPWKTVAEIRNSLGYLVKPELFTVKAILSVMNSESLCYAACPLVVNGYQCNGAITSNGYEWWNCDECSMTFAACDYRYKIFVQLADSTGEIYATTSQAVGEEIFGQTARELYLVKYEKQDHAQYNKIVMGVQNCEYLLEVKLNLEAFSDESETLPMFIIVKVESLNPSAENRPLVRRTSVGMRTGFSDLETGFSDSEARLRKGVRNFSTGNAINAAGVRVPYLLSEETKSNSL